MINKCPLCHGKDLRLHSHNPFFVNSINEANVICAICGNIGYIKFICHSVNGTFNLSPCEE